jgi:hypothetical protein
MRSRRWGEGVCIFSYCCFLGGVVGVYCVLGETGWGVNIAFCHLSFVFHCFLYVVFYYSWSVEGMMGRERRDCFRGVAGGFLDCGRRILWWGLWEVCLIYWQYKSLRCWNFYSKLKFIDRTPLATIKYPNLLLLFFQIL